MAWFGGNDLKIRIKLNGRHVSQLKECMKDVYSEAKESPRVLNRKTWPGMPKPSGLQNAYDVFFQQLEDARKAIEELTDKHVHDFKDDQSALKKMQSLFTVVAHDINEYNYSAWHVNETKKFRQAIRELALTVKKTIRELIDEEKGFLYALATSVHDIDKGCQVK